MSGQITLDEMHEDGGPFVEYFTDGHVDKVAAAKAANEGPYGHDDERPFEVRDVKWVWYYEGPAERWATAGRWTFSSPHKVKDARPVTVVRP